MSPGTTLKARATTWTQRTFNGLTWQGLGWIVLLCIVNAVRRTVQRRPDPSLGGWTAFADWLGTIAQLSAYGLVVALPIALAVVAAYNLAPPRSLVRFPIVAVTMIVTSALAVFASLYLEWLLECVSQADECANRPWLATLVILWTRYGSLAALFTAVFVYLRIAEESTERSRQAEVDRARFVQRSDEARLRMLEAQIEPHFLFNTLASVRRLYQTAPRDGAAMLDHLMRYLQVALPQMRVADSTLHLEVALTRSYLEIQRLRMGHRLAFEIDVPDELRRALVPPMMLVTLAENAIKHGLAPLPEGGRIDIRAGTDGDSLRLSVSDSGRGFTHSSGGGTGLANIRARLAALYGVTGRLSLALNSPRGVVATIALPLSTPRAA
jgi:signal transduction histidine kinase